nr:MAG TPA: hypothetical protein [Caudoviricetes sp.]
MLWKLGFAFGLSPLSLTVLYHGLTVLSSPNLFLLSDVVSTNFARRIYSVMRNHQSCLFVGPLPLSVALFYTF